MRGLLNLNLCVLTIKGDSDAILQFKLLTIPFIETWISCINYQTECLNRPTDLQTEELRSKGSSIYT